MQPVPILIPPQTQARLEALLTQRQQIDAQVDAVLATLRETLAVPEEYIINDIRAGFVAPPAKPKE
jgi:hypothetical protein